MLSQVINVIASSLSKNVYSSAFRESASNKCYRELLMLLRVTNVNLRILYSCVNDGYMRLFFPSLMEIRKIMSMLSYADLPRFFFSFCVPENSFI